MPKNFRSLIKSGWFSARHWWLSLQTRSTPLLVAGLVCFTVALALLPLFGLNVPDSSATIASAFLGAFIAVIGASWYARKERLSDDREIALAIILIIRPIVESAEEAQLIAGMPIDDGATAVRFRKWLRSFRPLVAEAAEDISGLLAHMQGFGAINITMTLQISRTLKGLVCSVSELERHGPHLLIDGDFAPVFGEQISTLEGSCEWAGSM